jgi:hypothetical protein
MAAGEWRLSQQERETATERQCCAIPRWNSTVFKSYTICSSRAFLQLRQKKKRTINVTKKILSELDSTLQNATY